MSALPRWRISSAAHRTLVVLIVTLFSACATTPPPDRAYTGRFSVTTTAGERRESVSGRFSLEVRGQQQRLDLTSPIGTTVARIEVEPGNARATGAQMQE
ncbi:MAG: lipoprotein insertase outer membrane protein LolB, partial [Burkholderiaceae bacterium]